MDRPSLAVALMVRNEADRYLGSALSAWQNFADEIVALDDHSTDASQSLLVDAGATTVPWTGAEAWGEEIAPRTALWNAAVASGAEYIMVLDADMVPIQDPKPLLRDGVDGVLFNLFDLWSADTYRDDHYWQAHRCPRLWLVKNPYEEAKPWSERGIHCGHFPPLTLKRLLWAPIDFSILHYGYADPRDREAKAAQYLDRSSILTTNELEHAKTILDPNPRTVPLLFKPTWPLSKPAS